MLTIYDAVEGTLIKREGPVATKAAVWIDLLNPTRDEDLLVEQALSISVPTREEMSEIEASSRLYHEGSGYYMTAVVLHQVDPPLARARLREDPRMLGEDTKVSGFCLSVNRCSARPADPLPSTSLRVSPWVAFTTLP